MFRDNGVSDASKLGYGLGGSRGLQQLPEHLVDKVRHLQSKKRKVEESSSKNLTEDESESSSAAKKGKNPWYMELITGNFMVEEEMMLVKLPLDILRTMMNFMHVKKSLKEIDKHFNINSGYYKLLIIYYFHAILCSGMARTKFPEYAKLFFLIQDIWNAISHGLLPCLT